MVLYKTCVEERLTDIPLVKLNSFVPITVLLLTLTSDIPYLLQYKTTLYES